MEGQIFFKAVTKLDFPKLGMSRECVDVGSWTEL